MTHEKDNSDHLPESLVSDLRRADEPGAMITSKVDRAMADMALEHFAARPVRRRRAAPVWLAAAATLVLAVFILQTQQQPDPPLTGYYADIDGSGQIDIADVLALARRGDQAPTQAELDAFAMRVVALDENGGAM